MGAEWKIRKGHPLLCFKAGGRWRWSLHWLQEALYNWIYQALITASVHFQELSKTTHSSWIQKQISCYRAFLAQEKLYAMETRGTQKAQVWLFHTSKVQCTEDLSKRETNRKMCKHRVSVGNVFKEINFLFSQLCHYHKLQVSKTPVTHLFFSGCILYIYIIYITLGL